MFAITNVIRRLRGSAVAVLASLSLACAHQPAPLDQPPVEDLRVEVVRDAERWTAHFRFPADAPLWAFQRSALSRLTRRPWRPESWQVITSGVTLERIGQFDALRSATGTVPREVTIEFVPYAQDLIADYDPALVFSNGSLALYTGHFRAFPAQSEAELEELGEPREYPALISASDRHGQVLYRGERIDRSPADHDAYVFFGEVALVAGNAAATILDPGLPEWIAGELERFTPRIFAHYAGRMGGHAGARPALAASWAGPASGLMSLGGSVSSGMVTMRFEGARLLEPSAAALQQAHWFIAHEAAHFWLGQTVRYDREENAWITEGGADLMAVRGVEALGQGLDLTARLDEARADCARLVENGGVQAAARRQEHEAYYACGSLFALAVEQAGAGRQADFFDFVEGLIRGDLDGVIGAEEWLEAAARFGVAEGKLALIRQLLAEGAADGAQAMEALLGPATAG